MECLLHRDSRSSKDEVIPFTESTYAKARECCKAWKETMYEREIAIANDFECAALERVEYYGYHSNCYIQFTRKTRIAKARQKARLEASKRMRPPSAVIAQVGSENAFPYECIFCRTGSSETLRRCRQPRTASIILESAIERKDQPILDQIVGEDLVARQLAYHAKCYLKYIKTAQPTTETKFPVLDEEAFRDFVANVKTEEREGRSCVLMTAMKDLFVKTLANDEEGDAALREKVAQQTYFLKKHCPYRMFTGHKLKKVSHTGATPWQFGSLESANCETNVGAGVDDVADSSNGLGDYSLFAQQFAMHLHEKMREGPWIQGSVPPELPNFLTWCTRKVNGSDEVLPRLSQEKRGKIMAIAQEIAALTAEHASRSHLCDE